MPDPVLVALRRKLPIWEGAGLTDLAEATKTRIAELESASESEPEPSDEPAEPGPPSNAQIRAWARDQDIDVPSRGRVPDDVVEQYLAAQEADGGDDQLP